MTPTFRYHPASGSFKTWLLNRTLWRIIAQFRKRQPLTAHQHSAQDPTTGTGTTDRIADPNCPSVDAVREAEWGTNPLNAAMNNVKWRGDPRKYPIFDCYVNKDWPPEKVAEQFAVSVDQVYQIKHRVTEAIRAEVARLEKEMTWSCLVNGWCRRHGCVWWVRRFCNPRLVIMERSGSNSARRIL